MNFRLYSIIVALLLSGCGGGSSNIVDSKIDQSSKKILTKNHWYNICEDTQKEKRVFKKYIFDDKSFYIKEYNSSSFKNVKNVKEYNIKYKTGLIEISDTKHQFECAINRGGVDNTINWILIDCTGINKNEMASYPGSRTIELAKKDIDECFINDDN